MIVHGCPCVKTKTKKFCRAVCRMGQPVRLLPDCSWCALGLSVSIGKLDCAIIFTKGLLAPSDVSRSQIRVDSWRAYEAAEVSLAYSATSSVSAKGHSSSTHCSLQRKLAAIASCSSSGREYLWLLSVQIVSPSLNGTVSPARAMLTF